MSDAPTKERPARVKARRREIDSKLRARIEQAVEQLIATLDALAASEEDKEDDGNAEAEPDHEPTFGWTDTQAAKGDHGEHWIAGEDRELDTADDEPLLGSGEYHPRGSPWDFGYSSRDRQGDQTRWADGDNRDREGDEHDGREPDEDTGIGDADGLQEATIGEQSLGSFDRMLNQENSYRQRDIRGMSAAAYVDHEQDDADREDGGDREQDAGEEPEHDEAENGIGDRDGMAEQLARVL